MAKLVKILMKNPPALALEAECLTPETVAELNEAQIAALPVLYGSSDAQLGDFCDVSVEESEAAETTLALEGDFSRVKRIGQAMSSGKLVVRGNVGFHCGTKMRGGSLTVYGNAGDWLGAVMEGGVIYIHGQAGHSVGAAYRGLTQGMRGGQIFIDGNVGQMVGAKMRGGLIAVGGDCGDTLAYHMKAGTILVAGDTGARVATGMVRGTVVLLTAKELMPTFYCNCACRPSFWGLLYKEMSHRGFTLPERYRDPIFLRYSGDALEGGKGEVLLCQ